MGAVCCPSMERSGRRGRRRRHKRGGQAEKGFSGVDAYIESLKKVGSMPVSQDRQQLPYDHVERHNFHRIPGYTGFVPGAKCKESVTMMRNGAETERLGQLLSR